MEQCMVISFREQGETNFINSYNFSGMVVFAQSSQKKPWQMRCQQEPSRKK